MLVKKEKNDDVIWKIKTIYIPTIQENCYLVVLTSRVCAFLIFFNGINLYIMFCNFFT